MARPAAMSFRLPKPPRALCAAWPLFCVAPLRRRGFSVVGRAGWEGRELLDSLERHEQGRRHDQPDVRKKPTATRPVAGPRRPRPAGMERKRVRAELDKQLNFRWPGVEGLSGYHGEEMNPMVEGRVKRKMTLVVCYLGTGRHGLQLAKLPPWDDDRLTEAQQRVQSIRGDGAAALVGEDAERQLADLEDRELPTIELALRRALFVSGFIGSRNVGSLGKVSWQRTSRTDKGVHSAMSVLCFKALVPRESQWACGAGDELGDELVAAMNEHLPADVRVLAALRTPRGWQPRAYCNSRTYSYMFPPEVLAGTDWTRSRLMELLQNFVGKRCFHNFGQKSETLRKKARGFEKHVHTLNAARESQGMEPIDLEHALETAYPSSAVERNEPTRRHALSLSEQVDDFERKTSKDDYFWRDIYGVNVVEVPEVSSDPENPWLRVNITGSSFMLHEIRLIMGMAIAVVRGVVPPEFVRVALDGPFALPVPKAPAQYLFLVSGDFSQKEHLPVEHLRQVIPSDERIQRRSQNFVDDAIVPHVAEVHRASAPMNDFLHGDVHGLGEIDAADLFQRFEEWQPLEEERQRQRAAKRKFWNEVDEKCAPLQEDIDRLVALLSSPHLRPFRRSSLEVQLGALEQQLEALRDTLFAKWRESRGEF